MIGQTIPRKADTIARQALDWNPQGSLGDQGKHGGNQ